MGCLACSTGLTGGLPETQVGHTCGTAAGRSEANIQAYITCSSARLWCPWAQKHRICEDAAACMLNELIPASRQLEVGSIVAARGPAG